MKKFIRSTKPFGIMYIELAFLIQSYVTEPCLAQMLAKGRRKHLLVRGSIQFEVTFLIRGVWAKKWAPRNILKFSHPKCHFLRSEHAFTTKFSYREHRFHFALQIARMFQGKSPQLTLI